MDETAPSHRLWLLYAAWGVLCMSCGLDVPEGPDLEELAQVYADPPGTITRANLAEAMEDVQAAIEESGVRGDLQFMVEKLEDMGQALEEVARADKSARLSVGGVVDVVAPCPGHDSDPTGEPGEVSLRATLQANELERSVWGELRACKYMAAGEPLTVDASVVLFLASTVPLLDFEAPAVLYRLEGTYESSSMSGPFQRDFRLFPSGLIEVRVDAGNGDVVVGFTIGALEAKVHTKDGSYCCRFEARECLLLSGDTCDTFMPGDEKLTW